MQLFSRARVYRRTRCCCARERLFKHTRAQSGPTLIYDVIGAFPGSYASDQECGDVLMISVDLAAIERLEAAVPLVLEICFDGRREAVWAEP